MKVPKTTNCRSSGVILILAMIFLGGCASTGNPKIEPLSAYPFRDRMVIGLVELNNKTGTLDLELQKAALSDLLLNELMSYQRFRIVEREKMNEIMSELKLQHSGIIKESEAIEVGHHTGADALLFVAIDSVAHEEHINHGGLAYTKTKKTEATLSARLVSVEFNELLASAIATAGTRQTKSVALGIVSSGSISDDAAVDTVLKQAILELANKIARQAPRLNDLTRN